MDGCVFGGGAELRLVEGRFEKLGEVNFELQIFTFN